MQAPVVLLVPIKPLALAKTRLRTPSGAAGRTAAAHRDLVLAMAMDTVTAARAAPGIARVVVITSDDRITHAMADAGMETIGEPGVMGLNEALVMGSKTLHRGDPELQLGALNADLPSLRPAELSAAVRLAGGTHSFCRDRSGTGTTLLLAGVGEELTPHFGPWSASAHAASGATELTGRWPSLRCDVDTERDLAIAARLGLGAQTRSRLARLTGVPPIFDAGDAQTGS